MPEMAAKFRQKLWFVRGQLKNEKLHFECAGASGSRLGPSRKADKNTEKTICEPTHLQTRFSSKKVSQKIIPSCMKMQPLDHLSGPVSPNPSIQKAHAFPLQLQSLQGMLSVILFRTTSCPSCRSHGPPGRSRGAKMVPRDAPEVPK